MLIADTANSNGNILVHSNTTWTAKSNQSWLTLSPSTSNGDDTIKFTVTANKGGTRTAIVTISANGVSSQTITVTQAAASNTWNGTGTWATTANWNNATLPSGGSIVVASGELTVNQSVSITDLTIQPNAKLTLQAGNSLTVLGNFRILSDASGNSGSFVDKGGVVSITGKTTIQQYLSRQPRNWYLSSPVSSAVSAVMKLTNDKLWNYDETQTSWNEITNTTTALTVMKGYVYNPSYTNDSVVFTGGVPNTGTQTIAVSYANTGYNLVGNPYPSCVDWEAATKTNVDPTMWYRTQTTYQMYVFETYNALLHIGTNNAGKGEVTQFIPPMQAVWTKVTTAGQSGQITFNNSMRSHPTANLLKADAEIPNIRLNVSNGINSDQTILAFSANASNAFDAYDSPKKFNNSIDIPELYTLADNEKLVINGMKSIDSSKVIPLGFKTAKAGTYTISASEILGLDGIPVVLEDKQLEVSQDLTEKPSYTFSSDSVNDANRFLIHLKADNGTTTSKIEQNNVTIYTKGYTAIINTSCNNAIGTVAVFNLLGQKVAGAALSGTQTFVQLPMISGTYFVRVSTDSIVKTKKIIVK